MVVILILASTLIVEGKDLNLVFSVKTLSEEHDCE